MMRIIPVVILILCTAWYPAVAQEQEDPLELFVAYQSGYMQVVALSCFQLYSSTGIIATDFFDGNIDGVTAQEAMGHNRLLLSACITSLQQIRSKTPAGDQLALDEISRLLYLLGAIEVFISAADNFFSNPTQESADAADAAQSALDRAMEAYAGPVAGQ